MWAQLGELLDAAFAPIFALLSHLEPVVQGIVLGLPVALLALLIYRVASNQIAITQTKDQIKGQLLALRIFRDDIRVILGAQGRIFRFIGRYLRLALVPMAILIVPVVLLLIQVESRYALQPLTVGEPALITIELDSLQPSSLDARLVAPAEITVETDGFRFDAEGKVIWRLSAVRSGGHLLNLRVGDETREQRIWVNDDRPELLDAAVYRSNDIRALLSPADDPIAADSVLAAITIAYPDAPGRFAGLSVVSWLIFASSLLFGFLLRRPLGVDF